MKVRHVWPVVAWLVLITAGSVSAQHRVRMPANPTFEVDTKDGFVSIPFELDSNHLIFPIRIKGTTFRVILDTGMPMSGLMLYDTDAVEKLDLRYGDDVVRIGGAGSNGRHIEARMAHGVDVEIGGIQMNDATAIVMPPLPHFHGSHDGVIGYGLFNRFVVRIDNDRGVVEFHDPDSFSAPDSSTVVPLEIRGSFPFIDIAITTDDGKKVPLKVVVDLGAGHALSLNVDDDSAFSVPNDSIRTVIGKGIGGPVDGQVGRIRRLDLAGENLTELVATFPDSHYQHPGGMDAHDGNLGNGVLRHFNVTFDYSRKRMVLERNERFDKPFEWDMSGMRLAPAGHTGLRIEELVEDSPAARAGLEVNDVVSHVNGKAVSRDDVQSLRRMMKQEGAVVRISVTRDGEPLEVELKLRRLI
jgi:hypothetical protein